MLAVFRNTKKAYRYEFLDTARSDGAKDMKPIVLMGGVGLLSLLALLAVMLLRPRSGHRVVYLVEGNGGWVEITTEGTDHTRARLPYNLHFYAPGGTSVSIAAKYGDDSPNAWIQVQILVDGKIFQSGKSSGSDSAMASGIIP